MGEGFLQFPSHSYLPVTLLEMGSRDDFDCDPYIANFVYITRRGEEELKQRNETFEVMSFWYPYRALRMRGVLAHSVLQKKCPPFDTFCSGCAEASMHHRKGSSYVGS